jgi:hypothetical protein
MATNDTSESLLERLLVIGKLQRRFRLPLVWWGLIIFAGYYLLPLFICAFEGVLITYPTGDVHAHIPLNVLTQSVGRRAASSPYLKDLTHLYMSVVVSLGGSLCIMALAELMKVYKAVSDPDLIKASVQSIQAERAHMERLVGSRAVLLPIALIAGSCGMALYLNGRSTSGWWGNPQYGSAGVLLACGVALVIFYGTHALYILAVAQYSIGRLVSNGVHLRPFHPDGCNGFGRLGNLLLLLLLMCAFCITAAYITIWHGYLGIEDFPGFWLAALGIIVFLPLIVIDPLLHVTIEVRRAQLSRLSPVEQLLNSQLKGIEDNLSETGENKAKYENLKTLQDLNMLAKGIYETSVFPFNRKVASVLSIGYVLQAVALAKEIVRKFK